MSTYSNLVGNISQALGVDIVFYVILSVVIVCCALDVLFAIFRVNYGKRERIWCVFPILSLNLLLGIILCATNTPFKTIFAYYFTIFFVCSLFFIPLFYIPEYKREEKQKQLEFARKMDKKVANYIKDFEKEEQLQPYHETSFPVKVIRTEVERPKSPNEEINFKHVKHVIERLSHYSLSQSEKKQISDLETAVWEAEQGRDMALLKNRINDGLAILLKIMSKYNSM